MGTPDFAVRPLKALYEEGHEIAAVVTQPDKPKGRHGEMAMSAVKEEALRLSIPVLQPLKASDKEFIEEIRQLSPELIVVAAYGQILKKELLSIPPHGCINIHASLLPRWRGASPISAAIMAGDEYTGVTAMQMDEGLDTGDMLLTEKLPIEAEDTTESLTVKLSELGAGLIVKTLKGIAEGSLSPVKQSELGEHTYAGILKKEDGDLDLDLPSETIERQIRGLYPWPCGYSHLGGKLFKIYEAKKAEPKTGALEPYSLLIEDGEFYVGCGEGCLKLLSVQLEGKKRMSTADFLRGSSQLIREAGRLERRS